MPSVASYIPPKDADLSNWATNFSTLITATPAAYGLTAIDAANIAGAVAAFTAAFAVTTSKTTKTAKAVSDKNTAKVTMLAVVRPYAQGIAINAGVASSAKIALGLNPRTSTPAPITAPASAPVLTVQSAANLALVVRYRDSQSAPSVKSKPYGVMHCDIYGVVSATPVSNPDGMILIASATKSPLTITRAAADAGKQLYLAARWKTRKGLVSPWSAIINFTVPAAV
jgi:hypothetical protein